MFNGIQFNAKDSNISESGLNSRARKRIRLSQPPSDESVSETSQSLLQKACTIVDLEGSADLNELSTAIL
jgi:hypothetical protein